MDDERNLRKDGERFIPGSPGIDLLEHLHRYALAMRLAQGKVVLDIASGEGYGSAMLAEVAERVVGVDISADAVAHAARAYAVPNLEYRVGSCAAIPLEDATVDLVVSFETIEHHEQHEEMLREIGRVLKPGGQLVISSPNKVEYSDVPGYSNPFHVKELYFEEFVRLLSRHFAQVSVFGQRVMNASAIGRLDATGAALEHRFAETFRNVAAGVSHPVYFIAIASNGQLPDLPVSLMEAGRPDDPSARDLIMSPGRFQFYFRGEAEGFAEERSRSFSYAIGASANDYVLRVSGPLPGVGGLRIDPADRAVVCTLESLQLLDANGETAWQWDGKPEALVHASECFFVARREDGAGGSKDYLDIVCTGGDPHFEFRLEPEVAARLSDGFEVRVRFSSRRLLPGYQIDIRGALAELSALRQEMRVSRLSNSEVFAQLSAGVRDAQQEAKRANDALIEAQQEAKRANDAFIEAQRREAAVREAWAATRRNPVWRVLNRVFRLESS